jgi:hypothetical protein
MTQNAHGAASDSPCVWASNKNTMVKWYNNEHRHLPGDDLPTNSTSCKSVYRQMALTIPGGPRGRGK